MFKKHKNVFDLKNKLKKLTPLTEINIFQTIPQQKWHTKRLFWFLDTGVQCLNTEHQCLN